MSKSYLGIAMLLEPNNQNKWIETHMQNIEDVMRQCSIESIIITSKYIGSSFKVYNETFNRDSTNLTEMQLKESNLCLLYEITNNSQLNPDGEFARNIKCFWDNFIMNVDGFNNNADIVLYTFLGEATREVIREINIIPEPSSPSSPHSVASSISSGFMDVSSQHDEENIPENYDCSEEKILIDALNEKIKKIRDKYEQLNNDKISMQRSLEEELSSCNELKNQIDRDYSKVLTKLDNSNYELTKLRNDKINMQILLEKQLKDCNEAKSKLEKEHDIIITKLDSLKEQISRFKSNDPQQIQINISNLQRVLERIQREAEQSESERQQEELRRQQEEERLRQEELKRQQEEERLRQEELKKQEEERITQEELRKQQEEERLRQEELRRQQEAERIRQEELRREEEKQEELRQQEAERIRQEKRNCPSAGLVPKPCENKQDYRRQSLIFHPDKNPLCVAEAVEKFKTLKNLSGCSGVGGGRKIKNIKKSRKVINFKKLRQKGFTKKYKNSVENLRKYIKSNKKQTRKINKNHRRTRQSRKFRYL